MVANMPLSFGDNVRVRATPATERVGVAGRAGNIHGVTTPSVTGVEVVGDLTGDQAFNVFFDELDKGFWFAPELLEFVDHAPGATIAIKGVPKKWVRTADGDWEESSRVPRPREWLAWLARIFRGRQR